MVVVVKTIDFIGGAERDRTAGLLDANSRTEVGLTDAGAQEEIASASQLNEIPLRIHQSAHQALLTRIEVAGSTHISLIFPPSSRVR
jgi:hypothetical protein